MKAVSVTLEKLVLKSLCGSPKKVSGYLFSSLQRDHWGYPAALEVFDRIAHVAKTTGSLSKWEDIIEDPAITEDIRKDLRGFVKRPIKTMARAKRVAKRLNEYRQVRLLFNTAELIAREVKSQKVDVAKVLDKVTNNITLARSASSGEDAFFHHGKKGDKRTAKLLEAILKGNKTHYIPTGIKGFDKTNVGLPLTGLALMGAPSGGGKSVMGLQIGVSMAKWGARVCNASLEMDESQNETRLLCNLAGLDHTKFLKPETMTSEEKNLVRRTHKEFHNHLKKVNGLFTFYVPEDDVSLNELLFLVRPYNYDVLIIDYLNLCRDMDGEDQWRKLVSGTRLCKRFAVKNKCLVILLVQMTDDGMLKYAKGMKDNANNLWRWNFNDESRESHLITVHQDKARNQPTFDFVLQEDFSTMSLKDFEGEAFPDKSKKKTRNKKTEDDGYLDRL